jgi:hypothetical protein
LRIDAGDRLIAPVARRLRPTDDASYPKGHHVCFNISSKFRPLTADWTADKLAA